MAPALVSPLWQEQLVVAPPVREPLDPAQLHRLSYRQRFALRPSYLAYPSLRLRRHRVLRHSHPGAPNELSWLARGTLPSARSSLVKEQHRQFSLTAASLANQLYDRQRRRGRMGLTCNSLGQDLQLQLRDPQSQAKDHHPHLSGSKSVPQSLDRRSLQSLRSRSRPRSRSLHADDSTLSAHGHCHTSLSRAPVASRCGQMLSSASGWPSRSASLSTRISIAC